MNGRLTPQIYGGISGDQIVNPKKNVRVGGFIDSKIQIYILLKYCRIYHNDHKSARSTASTRNVGKSVFDGRAENFTEPEDGTT